MQTQNPTQLETTAGATSGRLSHLDVVNPQTNLATQALVSILDKYHMELLVPDYCGPDIYRVDRLSGAVQTDRCYPFPDRYAPETEKYST